MGHETAMRLRYRVPDGTDCPNERDFRAVVMSRLGIDPFSDAAEGTIEVVVTADGDDWFGVMQTSSGGTREISGSSCVELVQDMAASLSVFLTPLANSNGAKASVNPEAASSTETSRETLAPFRAQTPLEPAQTSTPDSPDLGEAPSPLATESVVSHHHHVGARVGLGVIGSVGSAPAPSLGATGSLGIGQGVWSVDVEGRVDFGAEKVRADRSGVQSSIRLGLVVPCLHWDWWLACPVAAFGALRGRGVRTTRTDPGDTFYAAVGLRFGLESALSGALVLKAQAELMAPLTPTTLSAGGEEVWTTPSLAGNFGIGLLVLYP